MASSSDGVACSARCGKKSAQTLPVYFFVLRDRPKTDCQTHWIDAWHWRLGGISGTISSCTAKMNEYSLISYRLQGCGLAAYLLQLSRYGTEEGMLCILPCLISVFIWMLLLLLLLMHDISLLYSSGDGSWWQLFLWPSRLFTAIGTGWVCIEPRVEGLQHLQGCPSVPYCRK